MEISPRFTIEDDDLDLLWRFTAWMELVVSHASADYIRRHKNQNLEDSLEQHIPDTLSYEGLHTVSKVEFDFAEGKLSEAFSSLPLLRRRILTLSYVEELTAQEVADRLKCSVEYVYKQKHKAIKALRDQLLSEGHGE